MIVTRVRYALGDWERTEMPESLSLVHELDLEIVVDTDRGPLFISWSERELPIGYCIVVSRTSHLVPGARELLDMTSSAIWHGLIGQDSTGAFLDAENKVFRLSGANGRAVFCCAREGDFWIAERVQVSTQEPTDYLNDVGRAAIKPLAKLEDFGSIP